MKHYFQLQYVLYQRHLRDFGLHPLLGTILIGILFVGMSMFLFSKTTYASLIYCGMAISALVPLSETKRNDFLKNCFPTDQYPKLRMMENGLLALPFVVMLLSNKAYWEALILPLSALALAFAPLNTSWNYAIPTPFGRRPFEFAMGFRKTWGLVLLAYSLTVICIVVGNFNLGAFALILTYGICLSYYAELEDEYIVWAHKATPKSFLIHKALWGSIYAALLSIPIIVSLMVFFPEYALLVLGVFLLANLYLWMAIFGKYASFPNPLNLPYSLVLGAGFVLPPLLVVLVPFFFIQSSKRLQYTFH